jgi:adenosine deaminase
MIYCETMPGRKTLKRLPKVELHRHLEGSVRLGTIADLANEHAIDLGAGSMEELRERTRIIAPMEDLSAALEVFMTTQKVLCSYESIRRITIENVEDAYRDGVRLLELRFAPPFIAAGKLLGNDEIIEAVLDGITEGMESYPIQVGLIAILPRNLDIEKNREATNDVLRYRRSRYRNSDRICGFDLADSEEGIDPRDYVPLVDRAREAGLGITIHTGENTSAEWVEKSLAFYKPDRIGHGIKIRSNKRVMARVYRKEIMMEICPTSNWLTRSVPSLKEHPLPHLYHSGLRVSINSDDPHLMDIDLVHEYEICAKMYGFTIQDFRRINRDSLQASFLDEDVKAHCLKIIGNS